MKAYDTLGMFGRDGSGIQVDHKGGFALVGVLTILYRCLLTTLGALPTLSQSRGGMSRVREGARHVCLYRAPTRFSNSLHLFWLFSALFIAFVFETHFVIRGGLVAITAVMSQRIFDQLDRLERGARVETRPTQHAYNDSSADYSAYDGERAAYNQQQAYYGGYDRELDGFEPQPMVLDSFGEPFPYEPTTNPDADVS